jgi:hypothetical protein
MHSNSCPYVALGFKPPMNKYDPLFVIKVEDENVCFYDPHIFYVFKLHILCLGDM